MIRELLILTFLTPNFSQAQDIDRQVQEFVLKNHIDTSLAYSYPCSGEIRYDSCSAHEPTFLFWTKNSQSFLSRFVSCKYPITTSLSSNRALKFYVENAQIIDKEVIREPECIYFEVEKGKKVMVSVTSSVSPSCFHKLQFNVGIKVIEKTVDTYFLDFRRFENGMVNLRFATNRRTKFFKLIQMIQKETSRIGN